MVKNELIPIWKQVLQHLKEKISKDNYELFVKSLQPVGFYNNTFLIEVPNHFSRDWLNDRYSPLIKLTLKHLLNKDVELEFLLAGEIPDKLMYQETNNENQLNSESPSEVEDNTVSGFNPKYTFDTFVIGDSNRFAHAASLAVAETPAKAYNPLFIYGGVGLGKTHLMHAIGHFNIRRGGLKVTYVTSEKFTNELINSLRDRQTDEFRNKYRNMDILLIDDIQFLAKKERTQEEFFHTFNTLYEANKQIIISSDRPPKEIPTLEDRLRSRFEWGLITDIQAPDYETRIAILRKKAQLEQIIVPDETMSYIADKIYTNIRELEGALIRVIAYASLNNVQPTPELASKVLKDMLPQRPPKQITVNLIQQVVAEYYNIKHDDFKTKKRTRNVAYPRQIAMYLVRELTDLSLPKIGESFGGRDHTTVIHAHEKIATEKENDDNLSSVIKELINKIKQD